MTTALIGYTGFVGTTLRNQTTFDAQFNSSNIQDIENQSYDCVVCAGAPAAKWKANQDPDGDIANLNVLMGHLKHVQAATFVLISTVDVYKTPINVDETTLIETDNLHAYGKHRYMLEEFVRQHFHNHRVVRLPGLFGAGLKKNFLYDMIHNGESPWTHRNSVFQFYNMAHLWRDLQTVIAADVRLVNFATEPVQVVDVAQHSFGVDYTFETENPPACYDMRTRHADLFGGDAPYIAMAETIYADIRSFAENEKGQA